MRGTSRHTGVARFRAVFWLGVSASGAEPCESVIASEETLVVALPAQGFLEGLSSTPAFLSGLRLRPMSMSRFMWPRLFLRSKHSTK